MTARIRLEVFTTPFGVVTVTTDTGDGSGTRLCGVKLFGSSSRKVAEFELDRQALDALAEDFDTVEQRHNAKAKP